MEQNSKVKNLCFLKMIINVWSKSVVGIIDITVKVVALNFKESAAKIIQEDKFYNYLSFIGYFAMSCFMYLKEFDFISLFIYPN